MPTRSYFPSEAPFTFSGMPPTGPTEPSGWIVPVMAVFSSNLSPLIAARTATVDTAPELGPSASPDTWKRNSFPGLSPVSRMASAAEFHIAARSIGPKPVTSSSLNSTRISPSGDSATSTVSSAKPPDSPFTYSTGNASAPDDPDESPPPEQPAVAVTVARTATRKRAERRAWNGMGDSSVRTAGIPAGAELTIGITAGPGLGMPRY